VGMKFKIRKAKVFDLEKIKKVYFYAGIDEIRTQYPRMGLGDLTKTVKEYSKEIFRDFDRKLKSNNSYWIIAESDEKIVGFANAQIFKKKYGWLDRNYVLQDYRGNGIGKKFVQERMKWFRKNKVKEVKAKIFINNKASLNNIKKFGFKPSEFILEKELK